MAYTNTITLKATAAGESGTEIDLSILGAVITTDNTVALSYQLQPGAEQEIITPGITAGNTSVRFYLIKSSQPIQLASSTTANTVGDYNHSAGNMYFWADSGGTAALALTSLKLKSPSTNTLPVTVSLVLGFT